MKYFESNVITTDFTVKQALEKLSDFTTKSDLTLFVLDKANKIAGTLTDGDIRRGLLAGKDINQQVTSFMNPNFKFLKKGNFVWNEVEEIKKLDIGLIPMLDDDNRILKIIDLTKKKSLLPLDAVIIAGGVGQRLRPLTNEIPKPMLPVGDRPIIERNVDRLVTYGIENVFISVNYLADKIENHFGDGKAKDANISYIHEKEALGTIGSLSLIENHEHSTLLVMNSDLLTNIDFEDFYKEFVTKDADMAVASVPYNVSVPYAVMEIHNDRIISLQEKPSYTFQSNAGIYLIKKEIADLIPKNSFYNATDLMEQVIRLNKKLIYYPLLCYWLDIGSHIDYAKAQEDIKHINF